MAATAPVKLAWGFGGSAMQMEGAWNQGGKSPSVFDTAYIDHQTRPTYGTPFRSADHYHRMKEDLGYLGQLGATAYRFSVAWTRILPNCTGTPNPEGIKFYSDMIDEVKRQGAEPYLTMFHWDLPQSCQDQFNGWQSDRIIEVFADYANILFDNYGDRVNYWLTSNEPRANCDFCMYRPKFPPFTTTSDAVYYQCIHNSFLAHATVVRNARARSDSANWKISIPNVVDWIDPDPGAAAKEYYESTLMQIEWFFDPCFRGDYGPNIKRLLPLPEFTPAQQELMKNSCDYIGINIYNSMTNDLPADPPGETTSYTSQEAGKPSAYWPHPRPEGVRALPKMLYERYEKEVVITELGYHVPRSVEETFEQAVNDDLRVKYWEMNAPNVIALITEDNVPLTAVLAWCLIDNYEFESYEFRWGHIAVDYWDPATGKVNNDKGSLKRAIKKSAFYMRDFFGNHTVSPFNNPRETVQPVSTAVVTTSLASQVKVHTSNHPKVAEIVAVEMVSGAERWDYGLFVAIVAVLGWV